jgi:hypothetical protein
MHLSPKDSVSGTPATTPTDNNQVTITRYHVAYVRADGRNQQGVDVPFDFDGATTVTIPSSGSAQVPFELVRLAAKREAPLVQLQDGVNFITTIVTVTFYGTDLVGNEISAVGKISVEFGNFADKQ